MPINFNKNSVKWGKSGHAYKFKPGNKRSKAVALTKAKRQMRAIKTSQYRRKQNIVL